MRLFHFSDDPSIEIFLPRPLRVPSTRPKGRDWLNGPLVWAIDEAHQSMYLFPRECPRILLWPTPQTTAEDLQKWWNGSCAKIIAYVEASWLDRIRIAQLYRYEFPEKQFENLRDAGMWVSRESVQPIGVERMEYLEKHLDREDVELRASPDLTHLKAVWSSSLHASGIRLRNAKNWTVQ